MTERIGGAQAGAAAARQATRSSTEQEARASFADIVYADDELLNAAFDAIVAAEWPTPPGAPSRRARSSPPTGRAGRPPRRSARLRLPVRSRRTGADPRQRSPPSSRRGDRRGADRGARR